MNYSRTKTGGRTKGTPNKITNELRESLKQVIDSELLSLSERLEDLEPKDRVELLIKLLPYIIPKVQTVSHTENEPVDWSFKFWVKNSCRLDGWILTWANPRTYWR